MEPKRITVLFESIEGHTATVARKVSECLAASGFPSGVPPMVPRQETVRSPQSSRTVARMAWPFR